MRPRNNYFFALNGRQKFGERSGWSEPYISKKNRSFRAKIYGMKHGGKSGRDCRWIWNANINLVYIIGLWTNIYLTQCYILFRGTTFTESWRKSDLNEFLMDIVNSILNNDFVAFPENGKLVSFFPPSVYMCFWCVVENILFFTNYKCRAKQQHQLI